MSDSKTDIHREYISTKNITCRSTKSRMKAIVTALSVLALSLLIGCASIPISEMTDEQIMKRQGIYYNVGGPGITNIFSMWVWNNHDYTTPSAHQGGEAQVGTIVFPDGHIMNQIHVSINTNGRYSGYSKVTINGSTSDGDTSFNIDSCNELNCDTREFFSFAITEEQFIKAQSKGLAFHAIANNGNYSDHVLPAKLFLAQALRAAQM